MLKRTSRLLKSKKTLKVTTLNISQSLMLKKTIQDLRLSMLPDLRHMLDRMNLVRKKLMMKMRKIKMEENQMMKTNLTLKRKRRAHLRRGRNILLLLNMRLGSNFRLCLIPLPLLQKLLSKNKKTN